MSEHAHGSSGASAVLQHDADPPSGSRPDGASTRGAGLLGATLVVLWTLTAFWPSLGADFLDWDDPAVVVNNTYVHGLDWDSVRWAFTEFSFGHYQPLTWISYAADFSAWGLDPFGFHLTNLLLHAGVAVLLFLLCRSFLRARGLAPGWIPCALSALFFAVHPLRVESVAWVTERRDVLCGFFLVGSALVYLLADRREGARGRRCYLAGSLALFVAALLSKASAVAFPMAVICLELAIRGKVRWITRVTPFVVLALPIVVIAPLAQESAGAAIPWDILSLWDRLWIAVYGLAFYSVQTVWPHNLSALHELPFPVATRDARFTLAAGVLALLVCTLLLVCRLWPRLTRPLALTGVACASFLLPVLGFFQSGPQLVAGRYTYFAAMPLTLLMVVALQPRPGRTKLMHGVWACAGLGLIALSLATHTATRNWRTSESLWTQAVKVDPACGYCTLRLATIRLAQNRLPEAEGLLLASHAKLPASVDVNWSLVQVLRATERSSEELPYLNRVLQLRAGFEPAWRETARVLWITRRHRELGNLLRVLPEPFADLPWAQQYRAALGAGGEPAKVPGSPTQP